MHRGWQLAFVLASIAMLADAHARADEAKATSSLSWVRLPGTEACLGPSELSTRVEAKLGRAVFVSPSTADLSIEAHAEADAKTGRVRVVVSGTRRDGSAIGTRELAGPDCKSIEDGLVLVLALMIDRDAATAPPPPPAPPPAPPPPPPQKDVQERVVIHEVRVHDASEPAPSPFGLDLLAAFDLAVGRSPNAAPAIFVGGAVAPRGFIPIEIGFEALPKDSTTISTHDIGITELAGDIAACPRWSVNARLAFGACAGLRIGSFGVSGGGFFRGGSDQALLFDARVAPRAELVLTGPLYLYAMPGISIPFARQRVSFTDAAGNAILAYERPALGGDFTLGLGVRFLP